VAAPIKAAAMFYVSVVAHKPPVYVMNQEPRLGTWRMLMALDAGLLRRIAETPFPWLTGLHWLRLSSRNPVAIFSELLGTRDTVLLTLAR
jgi:hypothetical protein